MHLITAAARAASGRNLSARVAPTGPRDELPELAETGQCEPSSPELDRSNSAIRSGFAAGAIEDRAGKSVSQG